MRSPAILLLVLLLLPGCGNLQNLAKKHRAKKAEVRMKKLVEASTDEATERLGEKALGEIVGVSGQYVLIRPLVGLVLPQGIRLEGRHHGKRTSLLQPTPEKNGPFIAADLLEGTPQAGDPVHATKAKPSLFEGTTSTGLTPAPTRAESSVPPAPVPHGALPDLPEAENLPGDFDPANLPALPDRITSPADVTPKPAPGVRLQ